MTTRDYAGYRAWKDWKPSAFGSFGREVDQYFWAELRSCGIESLEGKAIFEVGFGNGEFAGWAVAGGAIYQGAEVIADLVKLGQEAGFDVYESNAGAPLDQQINVFDCIVAFDVLEHLSVAEIRSLLSSAYASLKSGGLFVARVPSGDSPFSRAIQNGDVTHRTSLGSSAVRQLAGEIDLEVKAIREPAFPVRGAGLLSSLRRLGVLAARRLAYPFIAQLFMGGGTPVLSPNLIFVLEKR